MGSGLSTSTSLIGPLMLLFSVGAICLAFFRSRKSPAPISLRELRRENRARQDEQRELQQLVTTLALQVEKLAAGIPSGAGDIPNQECVAEAASGVITSFENEAEPAPQAKLIAAPLRLVSPPESAVPLEMPELSTKPVGRPKELVPLDSRFLAVYEMADRGEPNIAIAQAVQMPLGEVELIINLRKFAA